MNFSVPIKSCSKSDAATLPCTPILGFAIRGQFVLSADTMEVTTDHSASHSHP